jgi:hypothetical protein
MCVYCILLQQWNCRRLQRHQFFLCLCSFLLLPFLFILFLVLIFRSFPYTCYSLMSLPLSYIPSSPFPSLPYISHSPPFMPLFFYYLFFRFVPPTLASSFFHSPLTGPISFLPSVFSFNSLWSSSLLLFLTLL